MNDVEELMTYDDERERGLVTPSIISTSYYSNEISFEEGPLEERVSFEEKFSSSNYFSAHGSYKKERTPSRTIQIYRSRRRRLNYDERILFWFISFLFDGAYDRKTRKGETIFIRHDSLVIAPLGMLWSYYDKEHARRSSIPSKKNLYILATRQICFLIWW